MLLLRWYGHFSSIITTSLTIALKLPEFPPLNLKKSLISEFEGASPENGMVFDPLNMRSFADISLEGGILNWNPFDLKIQDQPLEILDESRQLLTIKGNYGYDYVCSLPIPGDFSKAVNSTFNFQDFDPETHRQQLLERLEPLKGTCLQLKANYWTYEVCPFNQIRQLHIETHRPAVMTRVLESNNPLALAAAVGDMIQNVLGMGSAALTDYVTDDIILGRYVTDPKLGNRISNGQLVQTYDDGDICSPEIKIPRRVEVKYECSHSKSFDHIIDVTEVASCHYWIRVGTPRACLHHVLNLNRSDVICARVRNYSYKSETMAKSEPFVAKSSPPSSTTTVAATTATTKPVKGLNFWRERLRQFLVQEQEQFPLIHKILNDFMDAEHLEVPRTEEEVPEELLKKWLAILGIDYEKVKRENRGVDNGNTANQKDDSNHSDSKSKSGDYTRIRIDL